jgi:hypothetical protein
MSAWKFYKIDSTIDHGKSDELASGPNWKKIARFKRLESSTLKFQNDLAFLGRIGKPSLSEFPEIYDSTGEGTSKAAGWIGPESLSSASQKGVNWQGKLIWVF